MILKIHMLTPRQDLGFANKQKLATMPQAFRGNNQSWKVRSSTVEKIPSSAKAFETFYQPQDSNIIFQDLKIS